jgi:hypothetical protein
MTIKIEVPQEFIDEALELNVNIKDVSELYKRYIESFIENFHRPEVCDVSDIYKDYLESNID